MVGAKVEASTNGGTASLVANAELDGVSTHGGTAFASMVAGQAAPDDVQELQDEKRWGSFSDETDKYYADELDEATSLGAAITQGNSRPAAASITLWCKSTGCSRPAAARANYCCLRCRSRDWGEHRILPVFADPLHGHHCTRGFVPHPMARRPDADGQEGPTAKTAKTAK